VILVLYRRAKWKVVRGKGKVRVREALSCRRTGWPRMRAEIAKLLGVCPNKLPLVSGATKTHRGFPAPLSKEEEEKEEREEKERGGKEECSPFLGRHHRGAPGHFPVIPDSLEDASETVLLVLSHCGPKSALRTMQLVQGYLEGPAPEQGPTLLVQVPPDQFQCHQRELQDLQHLLFPGTADPNEQITMARARCKEGSHLVIFRDSIAKVRVYKEQMKQGGLWQLVLNGWKCMMACNSGAWSINPSNRGNLGRIIRVLDPLLPQRRGLHQLSNSLFGQVIKYAEGQIMANQERSLRTSSLHPSRGILSFLPVTTMDNWQGRSFRVCKAFFPAFQCMHACIHGYPW